MIIYMLPNYDDNTYNDVITTIPIIVTIEKTTQRQAQKGKNACTI